MGWVGLGVMCCGAFMAFFDNTHGLLILLYVLWRRCQFTVGLCFTYRKKFDRILWFFPPHTRLPSSVYDLEICKHGRIILLVRVSISHYPVNDKAIHSMQQDQDGNRMVERWMIRLKKGKNQSLKTFSPHPPCTLPLISGMNNHVERHQPALWELKPAIGHAESPGTYASCHYPLYPLLPCSAVRVDKRMCGSCNEQFFIGMEEGNDGRNCMILERAGMVMSIL